jgi:PAS domain S-box-containing protein
VSTPSLLLVDDRPQNLVALAAILEPLGHELVTASSGPEALRILLHRDDFAAILLDVQMPNMDGFEVASVIKQRERTSTIPIIFLTAISKDEQHAWRGYEVGAVDYVTKPLNPDVLRAKVAVFVELWEKNGQIREQAQRLAEQELDELRRESAEQYRQLADAMPQIVWTADTDGRATYYNRRWFDYTGMTPDEVDDRTWSRVTHPDDLPRTISLRERTLVDGSVFEVEYRFRAADGTYRWHLGRAVPIRKEDGTIDFWIGTATDIDDRKRIEEAQRFLLDAGAQLSRSLDWRAGLRALADLAVPRIADWCSVDLVDEDGRIIQLETTHADPQKVVFARELRERYPPSPQNPNGPHAVVASGEPQLVSDIPDDAIASAAVDEMHLELLRELGLRSYLCVPVRAGGRVLASITLVTAESGRRFTDLDLRMAEELALRVAAVAENAFLYEEVERRARAARVLETIADGVVLLDEDERVLLWNDAAEAITGIPAAKVLSRPAAEVLPGYAENVASVAIDGRPSTVPVDFGDRELWLSFSAVRFDGGTVYAFRDLTEERGLEQMRSDFVATVSHELRTPLAAIYGAAVTLRRGDLQLDDDMRNRLLDIVAGESDRLAQIVNDVLLASHLDSGQLKLNIETVDAAKLTSTVVEAARAHLPEGITLSVDAPRRVQVTADEQQLRQVLVNLVENAVKYSPDGGPVTVRLTQEERAIRWTVSDEGLGIPAGDRRRIFEKFFRLDPNMTRGIGGTGLGLYICRELVHRLDGRIWVESNNGKGSRFVVELPRTSAPKRRVRAAA